MTVDRETQKKRILYQSWYRGCKETDKIIGRFAKLNIDDLSDEELDMFDAILLEDDRLLYDCLLGTQEVPERLKHNLILKKLMDFNVYDSMEENI